MDSWAPPLTAQQFSRTMKQDGRPVLVFSIRRPAFPKRGKAKRLERYFSQLAQTWQTRWETVLYPQACQALTAEQEAEQPFSPWQAELNYTVTLWRPPVLSLRVEVTETGPYRRPLHTYIGETWDCSSGFPRTLRSFFPKKDRHWRKNVISALCAQAETQLASGESLLDPDCSRLIESAFDPSRFYLTAEGAAVFYPLYLLGPYAEGIPVFTLSTPLMQTDSPPRPEPLCDDSSQNPACNRDAPAPIPSKTAGDSGRDSGR